MMGKGRGLGCVRRRTRAAGTHDIKPGSGKSIWPEDWPRPSSQNWPAIARSVRHMKPMARQREPSDPDGRPQSLMVRGGGDGNADGAVATTRQWSGDVEVPVRGEPDAAHGFGEPRVRRAVGWHGQADSSCELRPLAPKRNDGGGGNGALRDDAMRRFLFPTSVLSGTTQDYKRRVSTSRGELMWARGGPRQWLRDARRRVKSCASRTKTVESSMAHAHGGALAVRREQLHQHLDGVHPCMTMKKMLTYF
uniref:Uncharacterized protein n=1 Tax=Oryza punctata TaxID=4537 RepID=A0A0E0JHN5_ORYPU